MPCPVSTITPQRVGGWRKQPLWMILVAAAWMATIYVLSGPITDVIDRWLGTLTTVDVYPLEIGETVYRVPVWVPWAFAFIFVFPFVIGIGLAAAAVHRGSGRTPALPSRSMRSCCSWPVSYFSIA